MIPRICWFLGVVILSLCAGFLLPDRWLEPCIRYAGYYFMLAGFVIWLLLIANVMRGKRWRNFFRFHAPAMVLAVALMISIFHISPPQFKILGDEANLVGVSMAMHAQKTTAVPV